MKLFPKHKKGGIVTSLVLGTIGLIISVIIGYVIVDTIMGASLLTAGGASNASATMLVQNFTVGVGNVASKLPTILLIAAVVLLFGVLVLLVEAYRRMRIGGEGGGGGAL